MDTWNALAPFLISVASEKDENTLVVDLSNVARDDVIPSRHSEACEGARLDRLLTLVEVWIDERGGLPRLIMIADRTLVAKLCDPAEKRRLHELVQTGRVTMTEYADPLILQTAEECGGYVLSRDQFRPFRRNGGWAHRRPERFISWRVGEQGIRLISGLQLYNGPELSRAEQLDAARARGLNGDVVDRVLGRSWRCGEQLCFLSQRYPERLPMMPKVFGERVLCPNCGEELIVCGGAPQVVALKVEYDDGASIMEFTLADGESMLIGRGSDRAVAVTGGLAPEKASLVSREHLEVRCVSGSVEVRDSGSVNGSLIREWDRANRHEKDAGELSSDWAALTTSNAIDLARTGLRLRRSGNRWPVPIDLLRRKVALPATITTKRKS